MIEQEILEASKIIPPFMGFTLITPAMRKRPETWTKSYWEKEAENGSMEVIEENSLYYHSDWRMLMKVVTKISHTKPMNQAWYDTDTHLLHGRIDVVYKNVLSFIQWYNQQPKSQE